MQEGLHAQVMQSIQMGASSALGCYLPDGPGYFYPVSVLTNVQPGMPAFDEETFGPVATVISYKTEDEAIELANRTPCDHNTLIRAARDLTEANPQFAVEAGMAALKWLVSGYGYEVTGSDVWAAYRYTMSAAEHAGCKAQTFERVRQLVAGERQADRFVRKILGPELGLNQNK